MPDFPLNSGRPRAGTRPGSSPSPPPASSLSRVGLTLPPLRNLSASAQDSYRERPRPPPATHHQIPPILPHSTPQNHPPYSQGAMGSPLPPPGAPPMQQMPQFYQQGHPIGPPPPHLSISQDPNGHGMRYALPVAPDTRLLSGGRHKKEIKRRTKTGCLTCRKRRIKVRTEHKKRVDDYQEGMDRLQHGL